MTNSSDKGGLAVVTARAHIELDNGHVWYVMTCPFCKKEVADSGFGKDRCDCDLDWNFEVSAWARRES